MMHMSHLAREASVPIETWSSDGMPQKPRIDEARPGGFLV